MTKDIHSKPFDEGTKIKLELFRLYMREWLPVFIKQQVGKIEIYDFFAGEGTDTIGTPGSPLIILDELKAYCANLKQNNTEVLLHFNDVTPKKVDTLNSKVEEALVRCAGERKFGFCSVDDKSKSCPFTFKITNEDFGNLFEKIYPGLYASQSIPRFLFLDQYGIKHINSKVFGKLTSLKHSDLLFFISSSHIMRFKDQPEFQAYIATNKMDFSFSRPSECHRVIYKYYKSMLDGRPYFLGQFSIKKDSNYYGLIFGSNHHLGIKKFLDVAWKIDPHTGETNHDIDVDPIRGGLLEFDFEGTGSVNRTKKLTAFERDLVDFLEIPRNNKSIYIFALENGICISKTNEILKNLEKSSKLAFTGDARRKGGFYLDFNHAKTIYIQIK